VIARRIAVALWIVAALAADARAAEPDKQACVTAYTEAQRARKVGRLVASRERLVECGQVCSGALAADCARWLVEIDDATPTVVLEVRDPAGADVTDATVSLDGAPFAARLDGVAVAIDPGAHVLRFERGAASAALEVTIREGEKLRRLVVTLVDPAPPAPPPPPALAPAVPASAPRPAPALSSAPSAPAPEVPIASYALAGAGVVALGVAAALGLTAKQDLSDLRDGCAPRCAQGDVDAVHDRMLAADVTLGVGLAALVIGGVLWLTAAPPAPPASATRLPASLAPGRAAIGLEWR
jgi:hypothetical protein